MRGAFGKPQGTVARVHIGQPIMSVRSSDRFKAQTIEALRRAKFKFPGRQKVKQKRTKSIRRFAMCLTNFFFNFRSSSQRNGASQSSIVHVMRSYAMKVVWRQMVAT